MSKQRDAYRELKLGKPSQMTEEKIQKLESLEFRFKIGKGKAIRQWDSYFADLLSFKDRFGEYYIFIFQCSACVRLCTKNTNNNATS